MSDSIDIRQLKKKQSTPALVREDKRTPRKTTSRGTGTEPAIWAFLNKDIQLFSKGVPDKIKESFYHELSVMLSAGVNIRDAIELVADEQMKPKYRQVFEELVKQIIEGTTLSGALRASCLFTAYEYYSIQIGEETGKLITVLTELSAYYKKQIDQKRQVIGALTYPVLVLTVAALAIAFMLTYVVPMFADVLKRFGGELPYITKIVMRASGFLRRFCLIFILLVAGIFAMAMSQKKKLWYRKYTALIIMHIPVIGDLVKKVYLSRFSNTMALLIGSRIPILQAIELVNKMVDFYPIESSLPDISQKILSGASLNDAIGRHSVYPRKMISMIKVGEEVNQLDTFFGKISVQYSAEIEHQTNVLSKFMEPLIIVVLGVVVGIILIAMYLPLFKLGQAV